MRRWQAVVLALGLVCGLSAPFPVHAGETENKCFDRDYTFNFLAENDLWGSGSDKHFTHGTRLSLVESRKKRKEAGDCQPGDDFHFMDLVRTISDHTPPGWLGIVGPESYAEDIQKWWHQAVTDSPRPQGWAHQLKNELGLLLNLERKW